MGAFEKITVEVSTEVANAMRRSVADGEYDSADQIVSEALSEWAKVQPLDERGLARLREAVRRSDESGPSIPADEAFAILRARIASRQAAR